MEVEVNLLQSLVHHNHLHVTIHALSPLAIRMVYVKITKTIVDVNMIVEIVVIQML